MAPTAPGGGPASTVYGCGCGGLGAGDWDQDIVLEGCGDSTPYRRESDMLAAC